MRDPACGPHLAVGHLLADHDSWAAPMVKLAAATSAEIAGDAGPKTVEHLLASRVGLHGGAYATCGGPPIAIRVVDPRQGGLRRTPDQEGPAVDLTEHRDLVLRRIPADQPRVDRGPRQPLGQAEDALTRRVATPVHPGVIRPAPGRAARWHRLATATPWGSPRDSEPHFSDAAQKAAENSPPSSWIRPAQEHHDASCGEPLGGDRKRNWVLAASMIRRSRRTSSRSACHADAGLVTRRTPPASAASRGRRCSKKDPTG